jgi:hypothetical protein
MTLLKLHAIRYAQAQGKLRLWTANDSVNQAVIARNEKLGFQRTGAIIRFSKQMWSSRCGQADVVK